MPLDDVQLAAQEQFARQSKRYGSGHILADVSDVGDERKFRRYIQVQVPGNLKVERPNQVMAMVERSVK